MARLASSAMLLLSRSITDIFSPALHPNSAQSNVHVDFSRLSLRPSRLCTVSTLLVGG